MSGEKNHQNSLRQQILIGSNTDIADSVILNPEIHIGDNVIIRPGVFIAPGSLIGDDVYIGANSVLSEGARTGPRDDKRISVANKVQIEANVTISPNVEIGYGAILLGGGVVTKDVPANAIVGGNPAQILAYRQNAMTCSASEVVAFDHAFSDSDEVTTQDLDIGGCELWSIPSFRDMRGSLAAIELDRHLPFIPRRSFLVYDVPGHHVRGEHAHKECDQFLIAASGSVSVVVDNGLKRKEVLLDNPNTGIYLVAKNWGIQYKFSKGAALLVFASHPYEPTDYIRDYDEYLEYLKSQNETINE